MNKIKKYINTISETDNAGYSEYDATPIMYDPAVKKWIKTLTGTDIILGKPNVYTSESGKKYSSVLIPLETGMNGDHFLEAVKELRPKGYELMPGQSSQGKPFLGVVKITDTNEKVSEEWNKVNQKDKTSGMSRKAVKAYRRENPGSKLQTAVTTKPSKLKPGSIAAKRRKRFCARMSGNKGPMKKPNGKPTPKALALRRWNCESVEEMEELVMLAEQYIRNLKK